MNATLPVKTQMSADIIRQGNVNAILPVGTWWNFEHYRKGRLIDQWEQKNVTTTEGINSLLNVYFHGDTQITTWHMALFEDDYTPLITDTYAAPGYTESTAYAAATRPEYSEAAATVRIMTNVATKASFTMNATKTIYGASLVGGGSAASTKGDTAGGGVLFCSSKFGTAKEVYNTDVLMAYCSITIASL